jgi:hypothetical protein
MRRRIPLQISDPCVAGLSLSVGRWGSMMWFLLARLPLQGEGEKERFIEKRILPLFCMSGNGTDYREF